MNTLDDELINRLRLELDELTAGVAAEPPVLGSVTDLPQIAPSPGERRRRLVLAAAVLVLLAGAVGLMAIRRSGGAVGTPSEPASSAPVVTYATAPGTVHPTPPTRTGWDLLEWGNVRLSLPPDLSPFRSDNACATTPSEAALDIVCGDQLVRVETNHLGGATDQMLNGLHAVLRAGDCTDCRAIDLYELASTVTVRRAGASPLEIIDTVGPSGAWRFGNEARPVAPADWKTVGFAGVSMRVPADWTTATTAGVDNGCRLLPKTFEVDPLPCSGSALPPPVEGVQVYLDEPPITTHDNWPEWTITVRNEGGQTVVVRVGFGVDPTVGEAILWSVGASEPTAASPTMPAAAPPVPYLAVGESVMLGAKPQLEQHGITTVAGDSAGPSWVLQQLQQVLSSSHVTDGVVIQLGTNGTVSREQYEAVLAELAGVPRVVVLTVRGTRPWIAGNNEIIRSLPGTHPNVLVVDWEARSSELVGHLASDGIHLRDDVAKQFFTDLILDALGLPTG